MTRRMRAFQTFLGGLILASAFLEPCFGRGFGGGGGGFHGGGGGMHAPAGGFHAPAGGYHPGGMAGGYHPGGMSGGYHPGGMAGGYHPQGNMSGARGGYGSSLGGVNFNRPGGMSGLGGAGQHNFGGAGGVGGAGRPGGVGGLGGVGGAGNAFHPGGANGFGRDSFGDHFNGNSLSRSSLNNFLGMPAEEGMHGLGASNAAGGNRFDVNHGSVTGPRGGEAAGTTVTGPRGNTVGRGAAVGPNGGAVAGRGVEGAGGAAAGQAVARGPNGGVAAAGAVRGPNGGVAARGAAIGPNGGYAAGFARVSPSGRYATAAAVRGNYGHYDYYRRGWYGAHPGAWYASRWALDAAWARCAWLDASMYCGYGYASPMYYDYGNNVVYQDNSVYVNGDSVGTSQQYYEQASQLATTGAAAEAPADGDWLPLGVFALSKNEASKSDITVQLAVNREGVVRGNYTDSVTDKTQLIHGSVDKKNQKLAFTVGDNKKTVLETGLYNLTKDESPCLIHHGQDSTEQWLLVRLQQPDANSTASK